MSTLKSNVIEPATGTNLSLGAAGDLIDVTSDTLQLNTWKDSGGNTLFVSDGSGNLSSVNSGLDRGGGPNLILSQTVTSAATLEFTSGLDSTYDKYMFVFLNINPATNDVSLGFHTSTDGGSSYGIIKTTTYFGAHHYESGGTSGLAYAGATFSHGNSTAIQFITQSQANEADASAAGILYLFTPSSTTYVKNFYGRSESNHQIDAAQDGFFAGYINTTSAINAIQFKMESGNFDGTIKMYGCR